MHKTSPTRLTRRAGGLMALEPRYMFDGAALVQAADTVDAHADTSVSTVIEAPRAVTSPVALQAEAQAQKAVTEFLMQASDEQVFALFNGGRAQPDAEWSARLGALRDALREGQAPLQVLAMDQASQFTSLAAFTTNGPNGQPTIFVNPFWVGLLDAQTLSRVLVEEMGHWVDSRLNPEADTAGDEGQRLADVLMPDVEGDGTDPSAEADDHGWVVANGQRYEVEFAAFQFVAAYEMVYDLNNNGSIEGNLGETAADKEQNLHNFNASVNLGAVRVDDGSGGQSFSGNDVSAIAINIGGKDIYGWISRPIKSNGVVRGFYFWTDTRFNTLAAAQADGNQDGDGTANNNRGFVLVVDQTWFNSQIASTGVTRTINNAKDGNLGSINVANVGSSSDRVDAALNSLLPVTPTTPTLVADTAATAAVELGSDTANIDGVNYTGTTLQSSSTTSTLTATTSSSGNVLSNDTTTGLSVVGISSNDGGGSTTTLSQASRTINGVTSSGAYVLDGKYGTLTIDTNGNYSYTPLNSKALVDALRTGTVTETFTYTASNSTGAKASTTLTVSVAGSDDAPVAYNDYNTAKETVTGTSLVMGYSATGNVLANDTDVDSGDGKSIVGTGLNTYTNSAVLVTNNAGSTQLKFTGQGGSLSSVSVGTNDGAAELYYKAADGTYYAVLDSAGKQIYATSVDATKTLFTFNADPAKYQSATGVQTISGTVSQFFSSHSQVLFKDTNTLTGAVVTTATTNSGKTATVSSTANSATTDLYFTGNLSTTYVVGTLITGTNVPDSTKVSSVSYDSVTNRTKVTVNGTLSGVTTTTVLSLSTKTTITNSGGYGTLSLFANGYYEYDPTQDNANIAGGDIRTETFAYKMQDSAGVQSTANLYITVYGSGTNDPSLTDDTASITEVGVQNGGNTANGAPATVTTSTISGGVLGNDLETTSATSYGTSYVSAVRPESVTIATSIGTNTTRDGEASASVAGTYGSLVMKDDGTYTYTLSNSAALVQALQSGVAVKDVFYYQVKNTLSGPGISWARLTIDISGANDIPSAALDTGSVTEDGNLVSQGNVLTNDGDVDASDTLQISQVTAATLAVPQTSTMTGSSLVLAGMYGDLTLYSDGRYSYSLRNSDTAVQALKQGESVDETYTYTVKDSKGATNTANLVITIYGAEDRPTIAVTGAEVPEGGDAVFKVELSAAQSGTTAIDLSLINGSTDSADYSATYAWNTDNGTSWTTVTGGQIVLPANATTFYVRVSTTSDNTYEGVESFALRAAFNAASLKYQDGTGTSPTLRVNSYAEGAANIYDNGYDPDGAGPQTADDDRPTLTVVGKPDVSEGSYAIFTVTLDKPVGFNTGIKLQLSNGTASTANDLTSTTMAVLTSLGGSSTSVANGGTYDLAAGTQTFYVRVQTKQDGSYEGAETFSLAASFTSAPLLYADRVGTNSTTRTGATGSDTSTILDDGTGQVYLANGTVSGTPDDDRGALSVTSVDVNEASGYAVFTVTGTLPGGVYLSLANASGDGGTDAAQGYADLRTGGNLPTIQYWNGTAWTDYNASSAPNLISGNLKVRVALAGEQDTPFDGPETFSLVAADAATSPTTSATGIATIYDDGTGRKWSFTGTNDVGSFTTGPGTGFDDDRPLTVNNIRVNEGSPYAVFTVTGKEGQKLSLSLADGSATIENGNGAVLTNGTEDYGPSLEYWTGTNWVGYTAGSLITLPDNGDATTGETAKLLVRTKINPDTVDEGDHTFTLSATNTSNVSGTGTATIDDHGGGDKFPDVAPSNPTSLNPLPATDNTALDDDRPITVDNVRVNEGSPWAVFTVTGKEGQEVKLSLADGTATIENGNGTVKTDGTEDYGPSLQYWDGSAWTAYTADTFITFRNDGDGTPGETSKLLVRTQINPDTLDEGDHTFTLSATNRGGTSGTGTATIDDHGGGTKFPDAAPTNPLTLDPTPSSNTLALDDDRPITVADIRVNEGSPWAVFTVTGKEGQEVKLSLADGTATIENGNGTVKTDGTEDYGPSLEYWDGSAWASYTANSFITFRSDGDGTPNETSKLLVRTRINPDALDEGDHTFTLSATNRGGTSGTGTATIDDHGGGSKYPDANPSNPTSLDPTPSSNTTALDDDRPISVNDIRVNEGSAWAVFTVTGKEGQEVKLSLADGTATIENGNGTVKTDGTEDYGPSLQYWDGSAWASYTANSFITFRSNGDGTLNETSKLLVRTRINPDAVDEGDHTFTLSATNRGGSSGTGTATIDDHGGGTKYPDANPANPTSLDPTPGTDNTSLDDDRGGPSITVTGGRYNEGSQRAVFTVNATAGLPLTLDVRDVADTGKAPTGDNEGKANDSLDTADIYYSLDGGSTWQRYTGPITAGNVAVLVAVDISNESDNVYEGEEQFQLVVTSGSTSGSAFGTIVDDGTGDVYRPNDANPSPNAPKDDDRPKAAPPTPPTPPAPTPPAAEPPAPPPPPAPQVPAFASALQPLAPKAPATVDVPVPQVDTVTSGSGFQIPVRESAPQGLTVNRGITDQVVESTGVATKVSMPYDAFLHSNKDAVIKLEAKQADNSPLPSWVQFDPATGVFEVTPPPGFKGKLDLKVNARDDDGREATAIFQMFVGETGNNGAKTGPQSRLSFGDKLRLAGKRPVTLVRVGDAAPALAPREAGVQAMPSTRAAAAAPLRAS